MIIVGIDWARCKHDYLLHITASMGLYNILAVPEPASWSVILLGGIVLALRRRKR